MRHIQNLQSHMGIFYLEDGLKENIYYIIQCKTIFIIQKVFYIGTNILPKIVHTL